MVDKCANPKCNKPLHYLRDGRVFVFEVASANIGPDGKRMRHMEHYWLCGDCEPTMIVEYGRENGVSIRRRATTGKSGFLHPGALAS